MRKQHEILTRENEKLARKLEQLMRAQGSSGDATGNDPAAIILDDTAQPTILKTLPKIEKQASYSVELVKVMLV